MQAYKSLEETFAHVTALRQALSVLNWDTSVMMPARGAPQRANQAAALATYIHMIESDPRVGDLIEDAARLPLDPWQKANVAIIARLHRNAAAVPQQLVSRKTLQDNETESAWREAKRAGDFSLVLPAFQKMLDIVQEYAAAKGDNLGLSPYDAMMDGYARDVRSAEVDALFDDLAGFLPGLLNTALGKQARPLPLRGPFPLEAQQKLARRVAEMLGFDFTRGRLDVSPHPFSTGIGDDVRITTRYDEANFMSALQTVAHEVGHGLYNRHTPAEWHHQPVGVSQNMGSAVHESQSLCLDMNLARSGAFWHAVASLAREAFCADPALDAENLRLLAARVERSLIRVDSNEVTYPAHIILRYRLEKDMVAGKLSARDLPEAWREGMKTLIGAVPPDDRQGCLQDIHWYAGDFGYFPAYALGAMMAAQYAAKMKRDVPGLEDRVARGDFEAFTGWLRENVHRHGCLYTPAELLRKATGEDMSAAAYKAHLQERYG